MTCVLLIENCHHYLCLSFGVHSKALKFYLHNVVPAKYLARTEVMKAFEQSVAGNRDLLKRLAK